MVKPSSFCTISTYVVYKQLIGLLLTLSIHHPKAKIYCLVDKKTKEEVEKLLPKLNLNIKWKIGLEKYSEKVNIRNLKSDTQIEFLSNKANIISYALEKENDTLFLDADIFILDVIDEIDISKEIGVSPHYIKKSETDKFGYYNSGCVWTKNKQMPEIWKKHMIKSRFVDQAAMEDVVNDFGSAFFNFSENYNFSWWRLVHSEVDKKEILKSLTINNKNQILYKSKKLKFVHTHFTVDNPFYNEFNKLIIETLYRAKKYKELICLLIMFQNMCLIKIPVAKQKFIWFTKKDKFAEFLLLLNKKSSSFDIKINNSDEILFNPNILLYDNPSISMNKKELNSCLQLLLTLITPNIIKN